MRFKYIAIFTAELCEEEDEAEEIVEHREYHKIQYNQIAALRQTKLTLGLPPREGHDGRKRPWNSA